MAREDPQLKLRLSEELKALVTNAAKANGRSVNAEIVARIEAYESGGDIAEEWKRRFEEERQAFNRIDKLFSQQMDIIDGLKGALERANSLVPSMAAMVISLAVMIKQAEGEPSKEIKDFAQKLHDSASAIEERFKPLAKEN